MQYQYYPAVIRAIAGPDKTVYVYFSDGKMTQFYVKPLIQKGGVFQPLSDNTFFSERLTVLNGTVAWDISGTYDPETCIDIDPFVLYEGDPISDPLGDKSIPDNRFC